MVSFLQLFQTSNAAFSAASLLPAFQQRDAVLFTFALCRFDRSKTNSSQAPTASRAAPTRFQPSSLDSSRPLPSCSALGAFAPLSASLTVEDVCPLNSHPAQPCQSACLSKDCDNFLTHVGFCVSPL